MWLAPTVCLPAESDLVEAIVSDDGSGSLVVEGGPSESDRVETIVGHDVSGPLVVGVVGLDGPSESDRVETIVGHDVSGPLVVGLDVVGPLVLALGEPVA